MPKLPQSEWERQGFPIKPLRPGEIRIPGGMHHGPRFPLPVPDKRLTVDSAMRKPEDAHLLGFTHCESGRVLADFWKLPPDIAEVIEFHHQPSLASSAPETTAVVYLADLLCRLRGLGYGYYEARQFDLASEPSWQVLAKKHPAVADLDLVRFTFELEEFVTEVEGLVDSILGASSKN